MFKHKLPQIKFSLHAYLEKKGGEALQYSYAMGSRQPIAHSDLIHDIVFGGERREEESKLKWPRSYLSPSYDRDHWVYIRHSFFFFWNVSIMLGENSKECPRTAIFWKFELVGLPTSLERFT